MRGTFDYREGFWWVITLVIIGIFFLIRYAWKKIRREWNEGQAAIARSEIQEKTIQDQQFKVAVKQIENQYLRTHHADLANAAQQLGKGMGLLSVFEEVKVMLEAKEAAVYQNRRHQLEDKHYDSMEREAKRLAANLASAQAEIDAVKKLRTRAELDASDLRGEAQELREQVKKMKEEIPENIPESLPKTPKMLLKRSENTPIPAQDEDENIPENIPGDISETFVGDFDWVTQEYLPGKHYDLRKNIIRGSGWQDGEVQIVDRESGNYVAAFHAPDLTKGVVYNAGAIKVIWCKLPSCSKVKVTQHPGTKFCSSGCAKKYESYLVHHTRNKIS